VVEVLLAKINGLGAAAAASFPVLMIVSYLSLESPGVPVAGVRAT
jgi:hypothetical protein